MHTFALLMAPSIIAMPTEKSSDKKAAKKGATFLVSADAFGADAAIPVLETPAERAARKAAKAARKAAKAAKRPREEAEDVDTPEDDERPPPKAAKKAPLARVENAAYRTEHEIKARARAVQPGRAAAALRQLRAASRRTHLRLCTMLARPGRLRRRRVLSRPDRLKLRYSARAHTHLVGSLAVAGLHHAASAAAAHACRRWTPRAPIFTSTSRRRPSPARWWAR